MYSGSVWFGLGAVRDIGWMEASFSIYRAGSVVRVEMTPYCFIQSIVSISFCECVYAQFIWIDAVPTAVAANNRTTSDRSPGNTSYENMNNTIICIIMFYFGSGLEVILRCCYYINWTWYFYLIINMRFNPIIFYVLGFGFDFTHRSPPVMVIAFAFTFTVADSDATNSTPYVSPWRCTQNGIDCPIILHVIKMSDGVRPGRMRRHWIERTQMKLLHLSIGITLFHAFRWQSMHSLVCLHWSSLARVMMNRLGRCEEDAYRLSLLMCRLVLLIYLANRTFTTVFSDIRQYIRQS